MGYQVIKELISDIDEFHNEAELREILQQILFICEENLEKEGEDGIIFSNISNSSCCSSNNNSSK